MLKMELSLFSKLMVVAKTLLVQCGLLCAILIGVWGSQKIYIWIDPAVFPASMEVPQDGANLSENEKGKRVLDAITNQMRRELDSTFGWTYNDIIFNRFLLDNRANRQFGVYHATKFLLDLYASKIAKLGSSDKENEFLYKARVNSFAMDPRSFIFPSAESSYRGGLKLLEQYKTALDNGKAVYNCRTDDLYAALQLICGENMLGYAQGLLENAQNLSFLELDNRIYEVQGMALVIRDFVNTLYKLYPEISAKNNTQNMDAAMAFLDRICEYDPLYITSSVNSGELVLSYLLFARARLQDVRDSIRI